MNREIRIINKLGGYDYPQAMLNGIDTTNVLASGIDTYTATEDCWAVSYSYANYDVVVANSIDNVILQQNKLDDFGRLGALPLKKGQIISGKNMTIYGIKH